MAATRIEHSLTELAIDGKYFTWSAQLPNDEIIFKSSAFVQHDNIESRVEI